MFVRTFEYVMAAFSKMKAAIVPCAYAVQGFSGGLDAGLNRIGGDSFAVFDENPSERW